MPDLTTPGASSSIRSLRSRLDLAMVARLLWPAGLVIVVFFAVGLYGFNPTDEGLIQAQALRILHGAIPHLDIVSPRPLGSPLLHTVDVLLPTPLVATSRLLALVEFMGYSLLLGTLTFRRNPLRWTPVQCIGVAAAFLVNLHVFPLMPWHTVDGLLLSSAGLVALSRGLSRDRRTWIDAGMLSLGFAAITKQSFFVAPFLGLAWVAIATATGQQERRARRIGRAAFFGALPGALYCLVVLLAGGGGEALLQLTAGESVLGEPILTAFAGRADARALLIGLALLSVALASITLFDHLERTSSAGRGRVLAWVASTGARLAVTALVVHVALRGELGYGGTWGMHLLWFLLVVIVWEGLANRRADGRALLVAALGWMAMLSWGYAVPNLAAGSIALVIVHRAWKDATRPDWLDGRVVQPAVGCLSAVVLVVTGLTLHDARRDHPYRDLPAAALTADLGRVDPAFSGIRTNPVTARYLQQAKDCIARYPAKRVAILPDNPILYAAFDLDNPFPSDWMFDPELVAPDSVYFDVASKLSRERDFLVLFQTVLAGSLTYQALPENVDPNAPVSAYGPLVPELRDRLRGRRIHCGSFTGVYAPAGNG